MEHDTRHWVMLTFDRNDKLLIIVLINGENVIEIAQLLTLVVSVGCDGPCVGVHCHIFSLEGLDKLVRELLKKCVLFRVVDDKARFT